MAHARSLKTPCLSNFCATQLKRGAFRDVIKYCSEILLIEPANPKALCRRGQVLYLCVQFPHRHWALTTHLEAYLEVGDLDEADGDLAMVATVVPSDPIVTSLRARVIEV